MRKPSHHLRQLAGATALATAAFTAIAASGSYLDDPAATVRVLGNFSKALVKAEGDVGANLSAGGFLKALEDKLKAPTEKPAILVYPPKGDAQALVTAAVVPPAEALSLPIPVCAQKGGKVLAAWNITDKGEVLPRAVVPNPEGSTKAACNATIMAAMNEMQQQLATTTPPTPPPTATVAVLQPVVYKPD